MLEKLKELNEFNTREIAKELEGYNWLTKTLQEEVIQCFPTKEDIDRCIDNQRNKEEFVKKASKIFVQGRCFASHTQLDQVAKLFLDAWGVKKIHPGKQISCAFSQSHNKKPYNSLPFIKKRQVQETPKEQLKCPFKIGYSLI